MNADVIVVNNIYTGNAVARLDFLEGAKVRPYIRGNAGLGAFVTNLTIEDPRLSHTIECPQPLETEVLQSDLTFLSGAGIGAQISEFLDIGVNYTHGSPARYMSLNGPEPTPQNVQSQGIENVTLPFATESQPDIIHEYHSGYSYNTAINLLQVRVAYRFQ